MRGHTVPATHAAHNIEIAAENLREELGRLEMQKQALERELAAVVAHLGSVQQTLSALQVVMADGGTTSPTGTNDTTPAEQPDIAAPLPPRSNRVLRRPDDVTSKRRPGAGKPKAPGGTEAPAAASAEAGAHRTYGKITDQIMEYFAGTGNHDVRARDVAAALSRDTDSGSINAVRSTLDRLVGASRLERSGRGLYRAKSS